MGQTHKAIPLTLALNLGAACKIEGTIPFILANGIDAKRDVTIQHPSGTINVGVELNGKEVESAVLYSTARLLMLGEVNIEAWVCSAAYVYNASAQTYPRSMIAWLEEASACVAMSYDIARSGRKITKNDFSASQYNSDINIPSIHKLKWRKELDGGVVSREVLSHGWPYLFLIARSVPSSGWGTYTPLLHSEFEQAWYWCLCSRLDQAHSWKTTHASQTTIIMCSVALAHPLLD